LGSLPGSGLGPPAIPSKVPKKRKAPNKKFEPISASAFFEQAAQVAVPQSGLDVRIYHTPAKYNDGTVMVCHHGAGYTGLSFACFAKEVTEQSRGECGILAMDARRHGKTTSSLPDDDLSVQVLVADLLSLLQVVFPVPAEAPSMLLVGHSMGGSVAVRTCPMLIEQGYRVAGVAVLDVVEGTAIEALPHMHALLNTRPDTFDSLEDAIEWHVNTNTIHNVNSARVSVPSTQIPVKPSPEEESQLPRYTWRTPLRSTAPYWLSWFQSLSSLFLTARTARLLVLAGAERLDRELMIGQMQGKFQLIIVPGPGVGHMIHEDAPTKVAEILVEFWRRNERNIAGIKKVGAL